MTHAPDAPDRAWPWKLSLLVLGVGAIAFVVMACLLIPWHPYPGGRLHPPAATSIFTRTEIDRATAYSHIARWLSRSALVVSLVVACLLGFTRGRRWVTGRLRGPWPVRVLLAVAIVVVIGRLLTLPFGVALQRQQRRYGLSEQPWGAWLRDQGVGTAITIIATSLAVIALLACTRRWRRAWPVVAGGLLAVLVVLGSYVYPVLVEPLFNTFHPLPDGQLKTQILALADKQGVHIDDVLVADASRRTTTLNAYVNGFGSTRRVVLYDTLLDDTSRPELLSVVAHELTHAKHNDVLVGTGLGAAGALVGVGLLGLLVGRRYGGLTDPAVVPVLLALFALGSALTTPLENVISRQVETRADVGGLRATGDLDSFVRLQRVLSVSALADPTPPAFSQWWFGSHPTALERIAVAYRVLGRHP